MNTNANTWISWITTGIGLASAAAATRGWITADTASTIVGAAGMFVPFIWGKLAHSDVAVVKAAGAVPGVKPVEVTRNAAPELQQVAADPKIKTVVRAP